MTTTPTILIVDDSRVSRMLVRAIVLQRYAEANVIEAVNGDDALTKAETATIDMATIDLNMPGIDGLTVATRLNERFPQIKIGLLTANVQDAIKQKAVALGIQFIAKPITEEKILGFLNA